MMNSNIPIFRAEIANETDNPELYEDLINSGSLIVVDGIYYAIGYLSKNHYRKFVINPEGAWCSYMIKVETLSIHYPNMIDSEKKRMFASIDEDGKGGDIIDRDGYPFTSDGDKNYNAIVIMIFNQPQYVNQRISDNISGILEGINNNFDGEYSDFKVIGIKQ